MINVTSTSSRKDDNSRIKPKNKTHNINSKQSFDNVLSNRITFEFEGAINELLDDLKDEEKSFLEHQSLYYLNRYRSIVEKLLKKILHEGFETKKLKRLRRDKADYTIINKINSMLYEIAEQITSKNNKAFNLLKSVEEIRGLLLDLVY